MMVSVSMLLAFSYQPLSKSEAQDTKLDQQPIPVFAKTDHPTPISAKITMFSEDFTNDTFPRTGWTRIQTNTGNNGVYNCYWSRFTSPEYVVRTYPASAGLWWSYNKQDEWLITPEISLTGSTTDNYYLRYWYYGFCGSSDSDHYYTKIITSTGDTNILYDLSTQDRGWNRYEEPVYLDLSFYAGQTVKIAWQVEDGPVDHGISYIWFIDDIKIGRPELNDMGVLSLREIKTVPLVIGETDTFKIRVCNFGTAPQIDVQVMMTANDVAIDSAFVSINSFNYEDIELVWTPENAGDYTLKFFTQLSGDDDATNDTVFKSIAVCPEYHDVPYSKNFNEDWGTFGNNPPFCGWQIIDNGNEIVKRWNRNDWFKGAIAIPAREVAAVRYAPREHQDEWLISPRINCSEADSQYTLSFWHQYEGYKNADPDTGYVLLSTDGGNTWTEITRYVGGVNGLVSYGYKMYNITSLAAGQSDVRIAFRYYAYNAGRWQLDDFEVMYTKNIDAMPIAINSPEAIILNDTFDVEVIVKNAGRQDLTPPWYVYLQMRDDKDSVPVNVLINPESTLAFIFQKSIPAMDTYTLTAWTDYPGDEYPINDILTKKINATGWVRKMNMPTQNANGKGVKDGGSMTVYLDSIFAFRGGNSSEFYVYNPAEDTWSQRCSIPRFVKPNGKVVNKNVKAGGSLTTFDTVIYALKGNGTNELWSYYPGCDTWIQKTDIPKFWTGAIKPTKVKSGGALVAYDNSIYAFKGGNTKEFWMYIPATDTWVPKCSLVTIDGKKIKGGGSLEVLDTLIYAFVGGGTNHFYAYAPSLDAWTRMKEPSFDNPLRPAKAKVKDGGALAALDGKIYAFRGGNKKLFGYYQPLENDWYRLEDIPSIKKVKHGGSLVAFNGLIYGLIGGNQRDFWMYTPSSQVVVPPCRENLSGNTAIQSNLVTQLNSTIEVSPNPFTKLSFIRYNVPISGKVSIKLYNATGRLVETLVNDYRNAGSYSLEIRNLELGISNGVYFVRYESNSNTSEIKIIVQ